VAGTHCTWSVPGNQTYGTYSTRVISSRSHYEQADFIYLSRFGVNSTTPSLRSPPSSFEGDGGWGENGMYIINHHKPGTS